MASRLPGFLEMFETEFSVRPASSFGDSFAAGVADGQMSAAPLLATSGGLAIYGNYCGPGHGDPTGNTPPVDAVDGVCRTHDLCYKTVGFLNCGCDRALITSMPAAISATPSAQGKAAGALVAYFFSQTPCICPPRTICFPFGGPCVTVAGVGQGGKCPP
jgi:Phospholipase A2